ncbi:MAG TPA: hypothetical protein VFI42_06240 [Thermomicrobiaceae bacterium]|nr:hypothetical protein [Thermomicrobiaceae bacterium]
MRSEPARTPGAPAEPAGIIDTIGQAFALLVGRPYLIWPPVLLDLFLWLGVHLSARPLTDVLQQWIRGSSAGNETTLRQLQNLGQHYNVFELFGVAMPSLVQGLGTEPTAGVAPTWIAGLSWGWLALVAAGLLVLGAAVGMAYLTIIGYLVGLEAIRPAPFVRAAARNVRNLIGFVLVTVGIVILLALPVLTLTIALLVLGINVLPFAEFVITVGVLCLVLLLYFGQDAIVISDAGPMRAVYLSYNVVRRNFWPTVGFALVSTIVGSGVPLAMSVFTHSPWSMPFALVGHAFIATGMLAASMLFYRERARALLAAPVSVPASDSRHS